MAIEYVQADLGYPRTPTSARLLVRFSNGETWSVPAQVIVDDRDRFYADEEEDTVGFKLWFEIVDWAANNMNWEDLSPYATLLPQDAGDFDYEDAWLSAEKELVQP